MKAKWSGMGMVDGRGKINGTVGSKNRSGAYLRVKVSGVNPQSTYQMAARNQLTQFSQMWRLLTQSARNAWNAAVADYARTDVFGDLRNPTGKNLFTRLNVNLANISVSHIEDPPAPAGGGQVLIGAIVITNGGAKTVAHTLDSADYKIQVWATPGVSPGKSFLKGDYRLIKVFTGGAASPENIATAYQNRFGEPAVGTKVGVRLVSINSTTGENSVASEGTTLTV